MSDRSADTSNNPAASSAVGLISNLIKMGDAYAALGACTELRSAKLEELALKDRRQQLIAAAASFVPPRLLEALAGAGDPALDLRLSKNPSTPSAALARIVIDAPTRVRRYVATHPRADTETLSRLAGDVEIDVRRAVAGNRNTPGEIIRHLVIEKDTDIDRAAASAPASDGRTLAQLWDRGEIWIRAGIAEHENCPGHLLTQAATATDPLLRRKSAGNPAIQEELLLRLLVDPDEQVRVAAVRNASISEEQLCPDPSARVRRVFARRRRLPPEIMSQLASDDDSWVRRWIARNREVPAPLLEMLATDSEMAVRRSVARNSSSPEAVVIQLAADEEAWVRAGIALREDIPNEALALLLSDSRNDSERDVLGALGRNPRTPGERLEIIARSPDKDVRRSVAFNGAAPETALSLLAADAYPLNRAVVARRSDLSRLLYEKLLEDPEPQVRFAAAANLARAAVT